MSKLLNWNVCIAEWSDVGVAVKKTMCCVAGVVVVVVVVVALHVVCSPNT